MHTFLKQFLLLVMIILLRPDRCFAVSGGFSISPPFVSVTLLPAENSHSEILTVANHNTFSQTFQLSVVDFGSLNDSGGVQFLGVNGQEMQKYKYSLASWLQLEKDRLEVAAGSEEKVKVTVLNKDSLTSGGHYGAVLFSQVSDVKPGSVVNVNQAYASLFFVDKQGGAEIKQLDLRKIEHDAAWFRLPSTVLLRFQNSGNVHLVPRGTVTVVDVLGRVVGKGLINSDSAIILPESFRVYRTQLYPLSRLFFPGNYTINVNYRYDGVADTTLVKDHYFSAGAPLFWLLLAFIIGLFGSTIYISKKFIKKNPKLPN